MVNRRELTSTVSLPNGRGRLRALVLHVAEECRDAPYFGLVKLNKIFWKADFTSFAERGVPVTGRPYVRMEYGPVPAEMFGLLKEMEREGAIEFSKTDFGNEMVEERVIPREAAVVLDFPAKDLHYFQQAINYYWSMTGTETSDDSHGVAWKTRRNMDPFPYELAYLSDRQLEGRQLARLEKLAVERGWKTL
jgi:Protein of unknown function (DUF4065)